jgi:hypothetical protein
LLTLIGNLGILKRREGKNGRKSFAFCTKKYFLQNFKKHLIFLFFYATISPDVRVVPQVHRHEIKGSPLQCSARMPVSFKGGLENGITQGFYK